MRRRQSTEALDASLGPFPPFVDDYALPYWDRVAAWESWKLERSAWCERRRLFAEAHGWPGGEPARLAEEGYVFADQPWSPEIEAP